MAGTSKVRLIICLSQANQAPGPNASSSAPDALVLALTDPETRENALLDLSKKRDLFPDLAPILWHSFGVIPALLQEIIAIYPLLSPPALTAHASNRVCNALALLQCVASHQETRSLFLSGTAKLIILFISLKLLFKWRVNRLGVIGALVKVDDTDVINFLLSTEIIPLCLRTMELGSEVRFLILYLFYLKIN